jgi:hypothetical protein
MIESAAHAPSPAPTNSADAVPSVEVPDEPGLYAVMSDGALRHIAGRPTSFVRTGSLLASGVTAGIHARRINTQIAGESAYVTVGPKPTFYYRVARNAPDQVVPGTLSLILTQNDREARQEAVRVGRERNPAEEPGHFGPPPEQLRRGGA